MSFVVDGAEWRFDGWTVSEIADAIDCLLDRVQTAHARDETVWIGDDLQTRAVLGVVDLWSLRDPSGPVNLAAELWQELAAWLGTAPCYLDEVWPAGIEETLIQIGIESPEENSDVAWAHHNVREGRAVGCIGLKRAGLHETRSRLGSASVHWIQNETTHRAFWRAAIDVEGNNKETLERLAHHAFPDLYFQDGVWRGLNRLAGGYLALRHEIRRYLSVLDDHGKWVFTFPPPALSPAEVTEPEFNAQPSNQVIERRFRLLNVTMAPENPDVFDDSKCRRSREIIICKRSIFCHWHGKLEPHRNRLHVHSPIPESGDKVVIGIIDEHLPLPG